MAMSRARAHSDVVAVLVGQGGEVERLLEDGRLRLAVRPGLLVYQRQQRRRRVTLRLRRHAAVQKTRDSSGKERLEVVGYRVEHVVVQLFDRGPEGLLVL